jgi:site-specific DNA-methyltransferase (adenine-specific)
MSKIICSDCLVAMAGMEPDSVDAIVTDPPYGLSFMGKDWDHGIPGQPFWAEAMRVAKPGAHLLAFGGTRTFHRLTCAIEDAGWEIRDCLGWLYGSGFPKSHNLKGEHEGWGTALKPAWEPIILARKPLDGTVAANVQKWGTGAVNVDGCRVGENPGYKYAADHNGTTFHGQQGERIKQSAEKKGSEFIESSNGRWPANIIHDGSDEVLELFPHVRAGVAVGGKGKASSIYGTKLDRSGGDDVGFGDSGSAARFFYSAKASRKEREMGMDGQPDGPPMRLNKAGKWTNDTTPAKNNHPTVKPLALMRYLCRLVTPTNGLVLDPFCGSGSTGIAAEQEGFRFIGIDNNEEYCEIARKRLEGQE